MGKRKYSKEDKLRIIKEASEKGVTATLEKRGRYQAEYFVNQPKKF